MFLKRFITYNTLQLVYLNARQYSIVKELQKPDYGFWVLGHPKKTQHLKLSTCRKMHSILVGLGRLELPTSPLSGVRSSHLSYRPMGFRNWWSWSGSNRRPPECKSGALPAELQPLNGRASCERWLTLGSNPRPIGCTDFPN